MTRKLENVLQELKPLAEQGNIEGFFSNPKNADKLSGLVGDIHNAVMDYQVCSWGEPTMLIPDSHPRFHYNETSMNKVVSSL